MELNNYNVLRRFIIERTTFVHARQLNVSIKTILRGETYIDDLSVNDLEVDNLKVSNIFEQYAGNGINVGNDIHMNNNDINELESLQVANVGNGGLAVVMTDGIDLNGNDLEMATGDINGANIVSLSQIQSVDATDITLGHDLDMANNDIHDTNFLYVNEIYVHTVPNLLMRNNVNMLLNDIINVGTLELETLDANSVNVGVSGGIDMNGGNILDAGTTTSNQVNTNTINTVSGTTVSFGANDITTTGQINTNAIDAASGGTLTVGGTISLNDIAKDNELDRIVMVSDSNVVRYRSMSEFMDLREDFNNTVVAYAPNPAAYVIYNTNFYTNNPNTEKWQYSITITFTPENVGTNSAYLIRVRSFISPGTYNEYARESESVLDGTVKMFHWSGLVDIGQIGQNVEVDFLNGGLNPIEVLSTRFSAYRVM